MILVLILLILFSDITKHFQIGMNIAFNKKLENCYFYLLICIIFQNWKGGVEKRV